MKRILVGGPNHGQTIDVRPGMDQYVFPVTHGRVAASFNPFMGPPSFDPFYSTLTYRLERFGFSAGGSGNRLTRELLVCKSDMSTTTAESYWVDLLGRGFDELVDRAPSAGRY